jgi:predicted small integral membrane protein
MQDQPELVFRAHIELAGIWGRVTRELELAHYVVAIGMHSAVQMDAKWLEEPNRLFQMQYNKGRPVPLEDVKTYWKTWILRGGFRDVAETLATTLEEIHRILALWNIVPKDAQSGGSVKWALITQMNQENGSFHSKNLPDKLALLTKRYGFTFPEDTRAQLLSINAARNCLVHRSGTVGEKDLDAGTETFTLKWKAICPYVKDSTGERVAVFPFETSKTDETYLALKSEEKIKLFKRGDILELASEEFSWVAWTQLEASQWAAIRLEEIGRAQGLTIQTQSP